MLARLSFPSSNLRPWWLDDANCEREQQAGNAARNETDPHQVLNKLKASWRPVCAGHNPERKSDHSIDQNPDSVPIIAEREKENNLDDPFGNENDAYHQGKKNHSEQRIHQ